jgi:hypothetical protein
MKSKKERLWWVCDRLAGHLDGILVNQKEFSALTLSQRERLFAEIADMQASLRSGRVLFRKPKDAQ